MLICRTFKQNLISKVLAPAIIEIEARNSKRNEIYYFLNISFVYIFIYVGSIVLTIGSRGRRGHDRILVGFTTTYVIRGYHKQRQWRCVLDTTLCDKVSQWKLTTV
jgi:hypothetical protein